MKFLKSQAAEISRTEAAALKNARFIERFLRLQEEQFFEYGLTSLLPVFEQRLHEGLRPL